jgi:hypothetical protein
MPFTLIHKTFTHHCCAKEINTGSQQKTAPGFAHLPFVNIQGIHTNIQKDEGFRNERHTRKCMPATMLSSLQDKTWLY